METVVFQISSRCDQHSYVPGVGASLFQNTIVGVMLIPAIVARAGGIRAVRGQCVCAFFIN